MSRLPLLVGEDNPYGADPRFALYHEPRGASGDRLRRLVLRVSVRTYLTEYERCNLCSGRWDLSSARASAARILGDRTGRVVVALGSKVSRAFFGEFEPFTHRRVCDQYWVVMLPHPSGRSRVWNDPESYDRATAILSELGLPVGDLA